MSTTHYSNAQNIQELTENASSWAKRIMEECKGRRKLYPILCYRGMSGIASATAIAMQLHQQDPLFKFGMVYVRKEDEDSHGSDLEMTGISDVPDVKRRVLVFVDDFICAGYTKRAVLDAIVKMSKTTNTYQKMKYALIHGMKPAKGEDSLDFVLKALTNGQSCFPRR